MVISATGSPLSSTRGATRTAQLYMRVAKGKAPSFKADFDRNAFMTVPAVAASVMCTTERILAELAPELGIPDYNDLWWAEPCAGTGEILKRMRADRRVGFDIYPRDNGAFGIEEADYTTRTLDPSKKWVVVTNMPFDDAHPVRLFNWAGEQNAVAIAIIVPTFFQRAGVENKLNRHYRLVHREVLPDNSFLRDGKIKHIASIFDIWVRTDTPRELIIEQTDHPDWEWLPRKRAAEGHEVDAKLGSWCRRCQRRERSREDERTGVSLVTSGDQARDDGPPQRHQLEKNRAPHIEQPEIEQRRGGGGL